MRASCSSPRWPWPLLFAFVVWILVANLTAMELLERRSLGQAEVLAFLENFTIPFDTNQGKQDLRMFKVQQWVSGCFRADMGAEAYCRIRGFLPTLRKRRHALPHALQAILVGHPLIPALG